MKKHFKSILAMTLATTLALSVTGVNVYADTTTSVINDVEVKDTVLLYGSTFFLLEDGTLWTNNADGDFVKFYDNVESISRGDWGDLYIILKDHTLLTGYYYVDSDEKDLKVVATDVKAADGIYNSIYIIKTDDTLWHASIPNEEEKIDDTGAEILSNDSIETNEILMDDFEALQLEFTQIAENVKSIEYLNGYGYFIDKNNNLWVHGYDEYAYSGLENPKIEKPVHIMDNVVEVSSSYSTLYVLDKQNNLYSVDTYDIASLDETTVTSNLIETEVKSFEPTDSGIFLIKEDDSLWAKGSNYSKELGIENSYTEEFVKIDEDVVEVYSDNATHSIYIKEDGSYWGMGNNYYNQLGVVEYTGEKYFDEDGKRFVMSDVKDMFFSYNYGIITKTDDSLWKLGSELYDEAPETPDLINIANDVKTANSDGTIVEYVVGDNKELFIDNGMYFIYLDNDLYNETALEVLETLGYDVEGTDKAETFENIFYELNADEYVAFDEAFTEYVQSKYKDTPLASNVAYVEGLYYIDTENNLLKLDYNGENEVIASGVLDVSVGDDYILIINTDNEVLYANLYESNEVTLEGRLDENYDNEILEKFTINTYDEIEAEDGTVTTKIAYISPVETLEFLPTGLDNMADVQATFFSITTLDLDGNLINYEYYYDDSSEEVPNLITIGDDSFCPLHTATNVKSFDSTYSNLAYITTANELWVAGSNYSDNIANIDIYGDYIDEPVKTLDNVQKVALGDSSTYVLTLDNELYGMGQNTFGELGFKPQGYYNIRTTVFKPTELDINFVTE